MTPTQNHSIIQLQLAMYIKIIKSQARIQVKLTITVMDNRIK